MKDYPFSVLSKRCSAVLGSRNLVKANLIFFDALRKYIILDQDHLLLKMIILNKTFLFFSFYFEPLKNPKFLFWYIWMAQTIGRTIDQIIIVYDATRLLLHLTHSVTSFLQRFAHLLLLLFLQSFCQKYCFFALVYQYVTKKLFWLLYEKLFKTS